MFSLGWARDWRRIASFIVERRGPQNEMATITETYTHS
ncbi:hypothetical protein SAMN05414139_03054 [Burkholderia sp. D7]|nr:hypothetical protein SAMN05414139_03054 [Burkholderia sp. D7]